MPIKDYRTDNLSPVERLGTAAFEASSQNEDIRYGNERDASPNLNAWELAGAQFGLESITGSLLDKWVYGSGAGDKTVDPDFDPLDWATDDFFAKHPYMIEPFDSGRVFMIPNEGAFRSFLTKKQEEHALRELVGQEPMLAQFGLAFPGQIVDALALHVATGGAGEAIALSRSRNVAAAGTKIANSTKIVNEWAHQGRFIERAARGAGLGGAANVLQEAGLEGINPDRDVDEQTAYAMAAGMGLFFGSSLPALGAGTRWTGRGIAETASSARVKAAGNWVGEAFAKLQDEGKVTEAKRVEAVQERQLLDLEASAEAEAAAKTQAPRTKETSTEADLVEDWKSLGLKEGDDVFVDLGDVATTPGSSSDSVRTLDWFEVVGTTDMGLVRVRKRGMSDTMLIKASQIQERWSGERPNLGAMKAGAQPTKWKPRAKPKPSVRGKGPTFLKIGAQQIREKLAEAADAMGLWPDSRQGMFGRRRTEVVKESLDPQNPEHGHVYYLAEANDRLADGELGRDYTGGTQGLNLAKVEVGMEWMLGRTRAVVTAADSHTVTIDLEVGQRLPGLEDVPEIVSLRMSRSETIPINKDGFSTVNAKPFEGETLTHKTGSIWDGLAPDSERPKVRQQAEDTTAPGETVEAPDDLSGAFDFPEDRPPGLGAAVAGEFDIPDPTRVVRVMRTAKTEPIIKRIEEKFGKVFEFVDDDSLEEVKTILDLEILDEAFRGNEHAKLGPIRDRFTDLLAGARITVGGKDFRLIPGAFRAPGDTLSFSPIGAIRSAADLFFATARVKQESVDAPVTNNRATPAEVLRYAYDGWLYAGQAAIDGHRLQAMRDGVEIRYTNVDGDEVSFTGNRWNGEKAKFNEAVTDYLHQLDAFERKATRHEPDHPKAVKDAGDAARNYFERLGEDGVDVGLIDMERMGASNVTGRPRIFLPQKWIPHKILKEIPTFKALLKRQWRQNRETDFDTGVRIDPESRPMLEEVIGDLRNGQTDGAGLTQTQRKQLKALMDEHNGEITEGEVVDIMGVEWIEAYREEWEIYADRSADDVISKLTDSVFEGAEVALPSGSVFKARSLQVNTMNFSRYLEKDIMTTMSGYHRQAAGKIAVRRAIKNQIDQWGPFVRAMLNEDLAANAYDPDLVMKALSRSLTEASKAASNTEGPGGRSLGDAIETAGAKGMNVLTQKLRELEGRPITGDNTAAVAGWKLMLVRTAPRIPYMAMMGMMTVSALPDMAATVLGRHYTPQMGTQLRNAINLFKEMPRNHLETLTVALNDAAHSVRSFELNDIGHGTAARQFGPGKAGRVYERIDRTTDLMAQKMSQWSGMNRWNTNMKRMAAYHMMQEITALARPMAKARQLIDGGMEEKAAMRAAGIAELDAVRMNRLGMNGIRSQRLLDMLDQYGVDWEGNRVTSSHKGFIGPEFEQWYKQDRDLFDAFTGAINDEVTNIIVEPKLLSRPLANNYILGRLFNQFQSFAFAWGNQTAPLLAQRPMAEIAKYGVLSVGLGGLASAIHNQLSGRRSFDETAQAWIDQPFGQMVDAVYRSALLGWLARPLGMLEKTPIGPAKLLGNEAVTTQSSRPISPLGQLGPFASWMENMTVGLQKVMYEGDFGASTGRQLYAGLPYQNLWIWRAWLRTIEAVGLDDNILLHPAPQPYRLEDQR